MNKFRFRLVYSLGVLTCALPLALSSSVLSYGNAEGLFDYSDGSHIAYLNAGDFLAKSGISLDQSEVDYLNQSSSNKLVYTEAFKDDDVKTSFVGETEYVFAHEKSYVVANGREWKWTPSYVVANSNIPFVTYGDLYVASFPSSLGLENVDVYYELNLDIAPQVYNSFINESYNQAVDLDATYEEYLDELAYYDRRPKSELEYDQQVSVYNQYLEDYQSYLNKRENYEDYLHKMEEYNENVQKYNDYLAAKEQYAKDFQAYKEDQEYIAYYLANIEQNTKEYQEFGIKYENSRYQLSAMNVAYIHDTVRQSSMADYILSNTVASVLARKDELSALGVPNDLIDAADGATVKLRTCFREYKALTNDEARYSYYYINYNYIKSNANILLRSLERLGRYPSVRNLAQDRGKLPQYNTLIFQLIYFCNAVNDNIVYNYEAYNQSTGKGDMSRPGAAILDENFQIDGSTYKTWLQGYEYIDTSKTATPATGILPTEQVVPLEPPKYLDMPTEPSLVQKPVAPAVVNEPIAPEEVLEPIEYDPDAVAPDLPSILDVAANLSLLNAYRDGKVVEKNLLTKSVEITINGYRNVELNKDKVAIFYNYDDTPIHFVFFEGTGVIYDYDLPVKPGDGVYKNFLFDYWADANGNPITLSDLSVSADIFPVFENGQQERWEITWIYSEIDSETNEVLGGNVPTSPKVPTKEATEEHYYVFKEWSPEVKQATENATYTAIFDELNIYDITYEIDGNLVVSKERQNYLPNVPKTYEDSEGTYYVITGWTKEGSTEPGLEKIAGDTLYHASVEKYYTITWNILGEVSKERYPEGADVSYKGIIPEEIRLDQYYSAFEFDQELGKADSNRTITATYIDHNYPQVLLDVGNYIINLTGNYLPKELPLNESYLPTSYNSSSYHYEITGWTLSESTYVAQFEKTPFISGGITYNFVGETLKVDASLKQLNEVDISYLLSLVRDGKLTEMPLNIIFKDGEVFFTSNQVRYLAMRNAASIALVFNDLGNKSYSVSVVVKTSANQDVLIPDFYPVVTLKKDIDYLHSQVYYDEEEINASFTYGVTKFRAQINLLYDIIPSYNVSDSASNAVEVSLSKTSGHVGDQVHLDYTVKNGYHLEFVSAYTKGGDIVQIDSQNNITIPTDDVIINFVCSRVNYSLDLYVDDALYASYSVSYGDTITLPTYIKKVGDETYEYLFTGWGINSETISVKEDTELHAQFIKVERDQKSKKKTSNAVKIAGYVAVGTLSTGLVVGLFFIFRKIIKH